MSERERERVSVCVCVLGTYPLQYKRAPEQLCDPSLFLLLWEKSLGLRMVTSFAKVTGHDRWEPLGSQHIPFVSAVTQQHWVSSSPGRLLTPCLMVPLHPEPSPKPCPQAAPGASAGASPALEPTTTGLPGPEAPPFQNFILGCVAMSVRQMAVTQRLFEGPSWGPTWL